MKKQFLLCLLIGCFSLTSCFPTGNIEETDFQKTIQNNDINNSYNEDIVYNLIIPDEYIKTYSVTNVKLHQFDSDIAEELFPGCTTNTTDILDRPEQHNYLLFQKVDSWVCFQDGIVKSFKTNNINQTLLDKLFSMPKPYAMIRDEFPEKELESFSVPDCVNQMERLISVLDLNVGSKKVFSVSSKDSKNIKEKYFPDIDIDIANEDCCIIHYNLIIDGLPIADYSYDMVHETQEWNPLNSSVRALFTKDGLISFSCTGVPDVINGAESQEVCTPEYAVSQMKKYIESTTLKGTLYGCEQRALVYWKEGKYTGEYFVRPVWAFGWSEKGRDDCPVPYYVDALNGHVM